MCIFAFRAFIQDIINDCISIRCPQWNDQRLFGFVLANVNDIHFPINIFKLQGADLSQKFFQFHAEYFNMEKTTNIFRFLPAPINHAAFCKGLYHLDTAFPVCSFLFCPSFSTIHRRIQKSFHKVFRQIVFSQIYSYRFFSLSIFLLRLLSDYVPQYEHESTLLVYSHLTRKK